MPIRFCWRGKIKLPSRITELRTDCGRLYAVCDNGSAWRIFGLWPEVSLFIAVRNMWVR